MDRSKNTGFADRLSAAAAAKKAQRERAARARSAAESPAAVEQRTAREAVRVARDARIAERAATKLAIEARQAADLAAAPAPGRPLVRPPGKPSKRPAMRNSLSGSRGKPPRKQNGKPLATPPMPPAKLGSEKADKLINRKNGSLGGERRSATTSDGGIWDMKKQRADDRGHYT